MNLWRRLDVVDACFFSADFRVGFEAGVSSGFSTKYDPRTISVMGTEQLPADLIALEGDICELQAPCKTHAE